MNKLAATASTILNDYVRLGDDETVGLVVDHDSSITRAFLAVIDDYNHRVVRITDDRANSSPIPDAYEALSSCDAVIAPTKNSITHSPETTELREHGIRVVTLPGVTEEVFERIYETDFEHIVDREKRMLDVIDGATNVHISTPSGTDIRLALDLNRAWHRSATHVEPGEVRNLPTGEIFTAPLEDRAEGTIVIDAWHAIRTEDEAIVHVEEGKIVDWSDGAAPYVATLQEGGPNGVVIAELGIGSNAAHTEPIGNTLHDEKIAGTCHIAFGLNTSFGGENEADVHQDVVLEDPAITADGDDVPC